MKRKVIAIVAALGLLFSSSAQPAAAYTFLGGYFSSALNGIGDGDLDICFENDPVFTSTIRNWLVGAMGYWDAAVELNGTNLGTNCLSANIKVVWSGFGNDCSDAGDDVAFTYAPTANDTYTEIWLNAGCPNWTFFHPVTYGYIDARGVMAHELGHALGLGHDSTPGGQVMTQGWCVWSARIITLSDSDADGIVARYPYLTPKAGPFPQPGICEYSY